MATQPELFPADGSPPASSSGPRHNLFLAAFPDRATAEQLLEMGNGLRSQHGLRGKFLPVDHLHVTLHYFEQYSNAPEEVIQAIGRGCEAMAKSTAALDVTFDQVMSFQTRSGNYPLVLVADNDGEANGALMKFHQKLLIELSQHVRLGKHPRFTPHLTLLYDRKLVAKHAIEPVMWKVGEMVLVLSEVGATRYQRLGQWSFVK